MTTIGWFDCGSGASGDMMLGALVAAGVPLAVIQEAVDAVAPEDLRLTSEQVDRNGIAARQVRIEGTESHHHRTWTDVRRLLEDATLAEPVRSAALDTFHRLAVAEARVHGTTPDHIHFHEVGALDAIADVAGACAGLAYLGLGSVHASPIAVGSGFVHAAHGRLPVPVPAVVELLTDAAAPSYAGQLDDGSPAGELCTPTGAALLASHVGSWGPQPGMRVTAQGFGAGTREIPGRPNALRLIVGEALAGDGATSTQVVLETNVDDLDPRLWSGALARMLDAGAADAWLTPILMKKGRPAHTVSVLVDPTAEDAVRRALFVHTPALGLRRRTVTKEALDRDVHTVTVDGDLVRVKVACHEGRVVNAQPEYEDIAAAAERTGRPEKSVLAQAVAAMTAYTQTP